MNEFQQVQKAFQELFPEHVASHFSAQRPADAKLYPEELVAAESMIEARKLEFAHGRDSARAALWQLEVAPVAIPVGEKREPIWPVDIVGSISHTATAAAAVCARADRLQGLGVDMETTEALDADLIDLICREDEEVGSDGARAKLLFSIKEAIYKCLYPTVGEFIDFREMQVVVDADSQSYTAHAHTAVCAPELMQRLQGSYQIVDDLVISAAWLDLSTDRSF